MKPSKLLQRLGASRANVRFSDLQRLAISLGFRLDRVEGSHHIYVHTKHAEAMLNLQPDRSGQAKPYQIKQMLSLVEEYNLTIEH